MHQGGQPLAANGVATRGVTAMVWATGGWQQQQVGRLGRDGPKDWPKNEKGCRRNPFEFLNKVLD
jgi:hypothetical protein